MLRAVQIGGILLAVLGVYGWYTNLAIPNERNLASTTGHIQNVEYTYDKYKHINGIRFSVDSAREVLFYPSFFPNFPRAVALLNPGASVQIDHSQKSLTEIWAVRVNRETVADFEGVKKSHQSNGHWGLALAGCLSMAVLWLEWYMRRLRNLSVVAPRLRTEPLSTSVGGPTNPDEELRVLFEELRGVHTYDRKARAWNWFVIWVFLVLPLIAGAVESELRGWKAVRFTSFFWFASICSITSGVLWIRAFNQTRYRIESHMIECLRGWPRKSWKVFIEDIEVADVEASQGNWILVLKLRRGGKRRIVLTRSMLDALSLNRGASL